MPENYKMPPSASGKPIKPTGGFINHDAAGEARRSQVEGINKAALAKFESNPGLYRTNIDEEGMYQCPQGNVEDPAYKEGRQIKGS